MNWSFSQHIPMLLKSADERALLFCKEFRRLSVGPITDERRSQVPAGVCNDEDLVVGEGVTFRLLDGLIAVPFAAKRA